MKLFYFSSVYEDIIQCKTVGFAIFAGYLHYISIINKHHLLILDPND